MLLRVVNLSRKGVVVKIFLDTADIQEIRKNGLPRVLLME